jgi:hypothetical protein
VPHPGSPLFLPSVHFLPASAMHTSFWHSLSLNPTSIPLDQKKASIGFDEFTRALLFDFESLDKTSDQKRYRRCEEEGDNRKASARIVGRLQATVGVVNSAGSKRRQPQSKCLNSRQTSSHSRRCRQRRIQKESDQIAKIQA